MNWFTMRQRRSTTHCQSLVFYGKYFDQMAAMWPPLLVPVVLHRQAVRTRSARIIKSSQAIADTDPFRALNPKFATLEENQVGKESSYQNMALLINLVTTM